MDWLHSVFSLPEGSSFLITLLFLIKRLVALAGVLIILWGAISALISFLKQSKNGNRGEKLDYIRLQFGRTIVLGLEFIVAADVIETTTAPDYYSIGILASLVGIRTLLTYFMNRELRAIPKSGR